MKYMEAYRLRKIAGYAESMGAGAVLGGAGMAAVGALLSEKGKRWRGALKGLAYGAPVGAVAGAAHENALGNKRNSKLMDSLSEATMNNEDSIAALNDRLAPLNLMQAIWDANKKVKLNGDKVEYK